MSGGKEFYLARKIGPFIVSANIEEFDEEVTASVFVFLACTMKTLEFSIREFKSYEEAREWLLKKFFEVCKRIKRQVRRGS